MAEEGTRGKLGRKEARYEVDSWMPMKSCRCHSKDALLSRSFPTHRNGRNHQAHRGGYGCNIVVVYAILGQAATVCVGNEEPMLKISTMCHRKWHSTMPAIVSYSRLWRRRLVDVGRNKLGTNEPSKRTLRLVVILSTTASRKNTFPMTRCFQ